MMRTAGLFVALGATLNFAFADVVCKPEVLHYKPRIITATEKAGLSNSIEELCSASKTDKFIIDQSGSTVFTITRTQETFSSDDCKAQFNSIIDACVLGSNLGGGRLVTNGLTLDVYTDASKNEAKKPRAPNPKKTKTKPAAKKPAAEKPAAKKPTAKKPTAKKPAAGKKHHTTKPKEQACPLKDAKAKKPSKQTLRSLISKILRRSERPKSPAISEGSCIGDEPMNKLEGWGDETFFGFQNEIGISKTDLLEIAKKAYEDIAAKHLGLTLLVAALYVPNKGIYFGTVPHGAAVQEMKAVAPTTAPVLWEILGVRVISKPTGSQSLYHAEDAAIWHAYNEGAVPNTSIFPKGSLILTWGKISREGQATKIPACNMKSSNIERNCEQTLSSLRIGEA